MRDDWSDVPRVLTMRELAGVYRLHWKTVQIKARRGDADIPLPAFIKPYRWRREDVRRHLATTSVSEQRRDRWSRRATTVEAERGTL